MQEAPQKSLTGNKYVYPVHRGRDWPSGGTQVSEWFIVQRINQPVTSSEAISHPMLAPLWAHYPDPRVERTAKPLCVVVIHHTKSQKRPRRRSSPHFLNEETEAHTEPAQYITSCVFSPYSGQIH